MSLFASTAYKHKLYRGNLEYQAWFRKIVLIDKIKHVCKFSSNFDLDLSKYINVAGVGGGGANN